MEWLVWWRNLYYLAVTPRHTWNEVGTTQPTPVVWHPSLSIHRSYPTLFPFWVTRKPIKRKSSPGSSPIPTTSHHARVNHIRATKCVDPRWFKLAFSYPDSQNGGKSTLHRKRQWHGRHFNGCSSFGVFFFSVVIGQELPLSSLFLLTTSKRDTFSQQVFFMLQIDNQ